MQLSHLRHDQVASAKAKADAPPRREGKETHRDPRKARDIPKFKDLRIALLLALVLLAGCSGRETTQKRVVGNGAYVSVWDISDEMDAMPLADRHCRQYGKSGRLRQVIGDRAIYECVGP